MRVLKCVTATVTRVIRYNGRLRGPLTLTPIAERLVVDTTFFYDFGLSRLGF